MLEVLFQWFLVTAVNLYWGGRLLRWLEDPAERAESHRYWLRFWTGFIFLSFLLQITGFFLPLTPAVKGIIWGILLIPAVTATNGIRPATASLFALLRKFTLLPWLIFGLPALIFLLKSAGRHEVFDEGAYHLPLIRMWETMGLVPGFANLNGHYGLNSTWHQISAFSNLDFIPGWKREFALNGLVATVLALFSASRLAALLRGENRVSAWLALPLPFLIFRNLLTGPSTDIPAIVATWFVFIFWIETLEKREDPVPAWPAFVLLPFWITVLKTSSAALLLVPAGMLVLAFPGNQVRDMARILLSGLIILGPWLLQNILLSGYAVFPIRFTAMGGLPWQLPAGMLEKKFNLAQFGAFAPPAHYTTEWFQSWLLAHNPDSRLIICLAFLGLPVGFFLLVFRPGWRFPFSILLFGTLLAAVMGWFFSITEPRYGFGSLVVAALLPLSVGIYWLATRFRLALAAGMLFTTLYGYTLSKTWREDPPGPTRCIFPEQGPKVMYRPLSCGNFRASLPLRYESPVPAGKPVFCWDCPLPCIPPENKNDSLRIFRTHWGPFQIFETRLR
jgi:hypothetical protein